MVEFPDFQAVIVHWNICYTVKNYIAENTIFCFNVFKHFPGKQFRQFVFKIIFEFFYQSPYMILINEYMPAKIEMLILSDAQPAAY